MDLPNSIPLADLVACHPEYNPPASTPSGARVGILEKHSDLYEGGERFERCKGHYLRSRQMDATPSYRAARLAAAHYTGQMASIIDWLAGSVFKGNPKIENEDPYWAGLNEDADGTGQDLAAVLYAVLLETLIHGRAHFAVTFPGSQSGNLAAAKSSGGAADGMIGAYLAEDVDDWGEDDRGQLTWARIRTRSAIRTGPEQAKRERWTWTYVTPEGQRAYSAERDIGSSGSFVPNTTPIPGGELVKHNYGGMLPVVRVEIPKGLWVAYRLASTQLAIYNADAALAFLYDMNCFQFPVITNPQAPKSLALSEMHALYLEIGGSANMLAPSGTPFEQLRQYIDKLEARLYLAVQAMGLQAASKDEHGRQSGVAKQRDMDAAHVLMACYRGRIKDALLKAIEIIKFARGEMEKKIEVSGLDQEEPEPEAIDLEPYKEKAIQAQKEAMGEAKEVARKPRR